MIVRPEAGLDGASERMVRRAGFKREGVLRSWELLRGVPVDCVAYSRLRDDEPVSSFDRNG